MPSASAFDCCVVKTLIPGGPDTMRLIHSTAKHLLAASLLLGATLAHATVYDTSASGELTGSRTVVDGEVTTNEPNWDDAIISWTIANNGNGTYSYTYQLLNFNMPANSHFTLDISDDAVSDPDAVTNATLTGDTLTNQSIPIEKGNLDGITGAVKFDKGDEGDLTYSFTSNREPVYGHFFAKGGNLSTHSGGGMPPKAEAKNAGFGNQTLTTISSYIPRPNGVAAAIPEPSAFLCVGLVALVARSRRSRQRARC